MLTGPKGKKFNFLEYSGDFATAAAIGAIEWDFFHFADGMEQTSSQFLLQNGQSRIPETSIFLVPLGILKSVGSILAIL